MAQSNFCPQCGAPLAPGQNFCPVCGAPVAAAPQQPVQPQQPQQPQQPVQPQQPQYQQPQYQQPQYQQAPQFVLPKNNLWAVIAGASIAFLSLIGLILGCTMSAWGILRSGVILGLIWFLCAGGLTLFYLAQRPLKAPVTGNAKLFPLLFMGTFVAAWLFIMIAFAAFRSADVLFIFAMLFLIAAGVFAVLSFLDLFKNFNFLSWGHIAVLVLIFFWFLLSILGISGGMGMGFLRFMLIITPLLFAGAAVMFTLHFMKAPDTRLF